MEDVRRLKQILDYRPIERRRKLEHWETCSHSIIKSSPQCV